MGRDGPTVAGQRDDDRSLLAHYRTLLGLRRADPRLHAGRYRSLIAHPDCYAYLREHDGTDGPVLVVLNFTGHRLSPALEPEWRHRSARVLAGSGDRPAGTPVDLTELLLEPDEALLLDLR